MIRPHRTAPCTHTHYPGYSTLTTLAHSTPLFRSSAPLSVKPPSHNHQLSPYLSTHLSDCEGRPYGCYGHPSNHKGCLFDRQGTHHIVMDVNWIVRVTIQIVKVTYLFVMVTLLMLKISHLILSITLMLVANCGIIKWHKKAEKWLKPWNMGIHLRVLSECLIQWIPTWQGLDVFQRSLHHCALDEGSLSIWRVKVAAH